MNIIMGTISQMVFNSNFKFDEDYMPQVCHEI